MPKHTSLTPLTSLTSLTSESWCFNYSFPKNICDDLKERGYNPIKQIVAYLISGDPGYISSYKECRNRILEFKREDIIEMMLEGFIKEWHI